MKTIATTVPIVLLACAALFGACGGNDGKTHFVGDAVSNSDNAGTTDASGADDAGAPEDAGGPEPVVINMQPLNISFSSKGGQKHTATARLLRPVSCQPAAPCQLIVVVGDRQTSPVPDWLDAGTLLAQATGAVVLVFNLPGRGSGGMKSGGINDYGGEDHVAATKEVMRLTCSASKDYIDRDRCGYLTIGYGLVPAARALSLHGLNSLKFVQSLVDVEGPTDRCSITESPEDVAKGIGPDDGPGVSDSACNFAKQSPHSKVYPPAKDGKPASIICSESAWPITKTDKNCSDIWWQYREPSRSLKTIRQRYWRLQFKHDHRLPSHESSRVAIRSMVSSKSNFFALNLVSQCAKAPTDAECEGKSCWLEGSWGTHFGPAPYAPDGAKALSLETLFGKVVPKYALWVADEKNVKNCR